MTVSLERDCTFERLSEAHLLNGFDCGNQDLNDFLLNDALNYQREMLSITYLFILEKDPKQIVCFFTVSHDGLRIERQNNQAKRKVNVQIPFAKQRLNYPGVKIGRLGVSEAFKGQGIGAELLEIIKAWFLEDNKAGCRFLMVDAYNESPVLNFYRKNGFDFLLKEEDEQRIDKEGNPLPLRTRLMFFDLMSLVKK